MTIDNIKPAMISVENTGGTIYGANITYNSGTVPYNSSSITYGGFYGPSGEAPINVKVENI